DLPPPAQVASVHAQGLRPRGTDSWLAIGVMSRFAFRFSEQRQRPGFRYFAVPWLACRFPLSTLRLPPRDGLRMTRGQGDSPFLPCIGLPPTTTCQFLLAHSE